MMMNSMINFFLTVIAPFVVLKSLLGNNKLEYLFWKTPTSLISQQNTIHIQVNLINSCLDLPRDFVGNACMLLEVRDAQK